MQRLRQPYVGEGLPPGGDVPGAIKKPASPSEWRGDVAGPGPRRSRVVEAKVRKFRTSMALYILVLLAVVAWLVLSFTVWGNPSPGKRAGQLIDAVNEREEESFISLLMEEDRGSAQLLFDKVTDYLGAGGEFREVKFRVEKKDRYMAYAYLQSGRVVRESGPEQDLTADDGLVVYIENHGGKWYVKSGGTKLIP